METITRYYVKYTVKVSDHPVYRLHVKTKSFTIECADKKTALHRGNVMNYDNVENVSIYSKTYINILNKEIPISKKKIFDVKKK